MSLARTLALSLLVAGVGAVASPPRAAAEEPAVVDVSIFYDALEPYGTWMHVAPYGWVWQPAEVDVGWRPYADGGSWVWVEEYGWTWLSTYEWGWAPFHYGRWFFDPSYGWLWVPGPVWSPAWVAWRSGPGWIGWVPLPPEVEVRETLVVNVDLAAPTYLYAWSFVPVRWFADVGLSRYVVAAPWNAVLLRRTQDRTRYVRSGTYLVNRSIDVGTVEGAGVRVERRRLRESSDRRSRVEGDAVVVFRPKVTEGKPSRAPRATTNDDARKARSSDRRARLERHLEEQRKALDGKPPEGLAGDDVEKAREENKKAFEAHRARVLEGAKDERRGRGSDDAPPPSQPAPQDPKPEGQPVPDDGHQRGRDGKKPEDRVQPPVPPAPPPPPPGADKAPMPPPPPPKDEKKPEDDGQPKDDDRKRDKDKDKDKDGKDDEDDESGMDDKDRSKEKEKEKAKKD